MIKYIDLHICWCFHILYLYACINIYIYIYIYIIDIILLMKSILIIINRIYKITREAHDLEVLESIRDDD